MYSVPTTFYKYVVFGKIFQAMLSFELLMFVD